VRGEVDTGSDDRVDRIKHVSGQHGVCGGELRVQVVQCAGTDDCAGHGGVRRHETERELDHRQAGLVGDLGQLLDAAAAASEIRPDMDAYGLLRGIGNLCVGADGDSRYDARRMVELLIAGLRQSRPANQRSSQSRSGRRL
jgi:hypothetical protein